MDFAVSVGMFITVGLTICGVLAVVLVVVVGLEKISCWIKNIKR